MEYLIFLFLPFLAYLGARTSRKTKVSNKYLIFPPLVSFAVDSFCQEYKILISGSTSNI
jgi:hypothetical protein